MRYLAFLVLLLGAVAAGCASSAAGGCDPATELCSCTADSDDCADGYVCGGEFCVSDVDGGAPVIDAGPTFDAVFVVDAGPTFDAAPKQPFGEPCSDKGQCESNICILVGIGGVCSETCTAGTCPMDYGCVGVFGAIDPGEVADVCVPETTQLCTQCAADSECSLIGSDKCIEYEPGKKFCGRDCSAIGCPAGYTCETVAVDAVNYEQCVPNSGACDCNAGLIDDTEGCEITTPFGTCAGLRTCLGATGWGSCAPPSATDTPDGSFTDDNCDGIDGDVTKGVFVSMLSGADSATCGLVYTDPCATINQGILRAVTESRGEVYVQRGDYAEVVAMINGIDIYGGYDLTWQRGVHTQAANKVTITGAKDDGLGGDGEYLTIRAHDLIVPTIIADLVIIGPNASGTVARKGKGSYAVHVDAAKLSLVRVSIQVGNGANGATGSAGLPGSSGGASAAMKGKNGGGANEFATSCNNTSRGASGARGTNSCSGPSSRSPNGGRGGYGGTMDTSCSASLCFGSGCNARAGEAGLPASYVNGTWGKGGPGGSGGGSCGTITVFGKSGYVANGARGTGASSAAGLMSGSYWYGNNGGGGSTGSNGGGGGGGGGSGGCDIGIDSYGAGGGGGGAGGCAATSGGGGGGAGGGSFGVFVANGAVVDIAGCTIARGNGGNGGRGGAGGHGQAGGGNGSGGPADGDSKVGGRGGAGGHGGHGGGGGGGAGGMSAGVFTFQATLTHDCTFSGGAGGGLGAGGASAPSAPTGIRDGNPGTSGAPGELAGARTCAAAGGC